MGVGKGGANFHVFISHYVSMVYGDTKIGLGQARTENLTLMMSVNTVCKQDGKTFLPTP